MNEFLLIMRNGVFVTIPTAAIVVLLAAFHLLSMLAPLILFLVISFGVGIIVSMLRGEVDIE